MSDREKHRNGADCVRLEEIPRLCRERAEIIALVSDVPDGAKTLRRIKLLTSDRLHNRSGRAHIQHNPGNPVEWTLQVDNDGQTWIEGCRI